jgi:hypothetical protein
MRVLEARRTSTGAGQTTLQIASSPARALVRFRRAMRRVRDLT